MKATTGKVVVLVFVALGLFTVLGVLAIRLLGPERPPALALAIDEAVVASSPFTRFRAMQIKVGKGCKNVLVASNDVQRVQGLRGVTSTAPYAGMLFAFDADTSGSFTMANTEMPIDITFYDGDGKPVGSAQMVPCPGTDATCPNYGPGRPYRYALETAAGQMPTGSLSTCS